jgi:PilZ domain
MKPGHLVGSRLVRRHHIRQASTPRQGEPGPEVRPGRSAGNLRIIESLRGLPFNCATHCSNLEGQETVSSTSFVAETALPVLPFAPRPAAPAAADAESRRSARRRVLRNALIVFRNGHCTLRCQVCNISETGAMLRPADLSSCPNGFVLRIQDGPSHHCEVVWRRSGMVGVRFL